MAWIPVTKQLPDNNRDVLMTLRDAAGNRHRECGFLDIPNTREWHYSTGDRVKLATVIAWTELPAPYLEASGKGVHD